MNRDEILNRAHECVTESRQKTYGDAHKNAETIAAFWTVWLRGRGYLLPNESLEPLDSFMMLGLMKDARVLANPQHQDTFVDGCGYRALAGEEASSD